MLPPFDFIITHDYPWYLVTAGRCWLSKWIVALYPSSEIQGQIVGTRKSLNGRKSMAWRKVKNGEKSPWGQCLTRPVPNSCRHSVFWLVPGNLFFSGTNQKPEWRRLFGTGLVRLCPQGLFSAFFTFLRAIFFRPFRLFVVPTICPWVSEDALYPHLWSGVSDMFTLTFSLPLLNNYSCPPLADLSTRYSLQLISRWLSFRLPWILT